MVQVRAARFQNSFQVFQRAFGLLANIAENELVRTGINCDLAGNEQKAVGFHRLRVRPDGLGTSIGKHNILHGVAS